MAAKTDSSSSDMVSTSTPVLGWFCEDVPGRLDAIHVGHVEVHDNDIWRCAGCERYRLFAVGCLADHCCIGEGGEQGAQPLAEDGVVVRKEHSQWCGHAVVSGRCASTRVPPPGVTATSHWPPSSRARCAMDGRPTPCGWSADSPMPSSCTSTVRSS